MDEAIIVTILPDATSLETTDFPLPDLSAVSQTRTYTSADNDWQTFWDIVNETSAAETLFVDSSLSDSPAADDAAAEVDQPSAPEVRLIDDFESDESVALNTRAVPVVAIVGIAVTAVAATIGIVRWIIDQNWDNHRRRSEFTQTVVRRLRANDPRFNYVICSTRHDIRVEGQHRRDYSQETVSLPVWWGLGSVRYQVYAFRAGAFRLLGDGGYLNWAYFGNRVSDTGGRQPRTVVFRSP